MRIETVLKICNALNITPDEVLTEEKDVSCMTQEELSERLDSCTKKEREVAMQLLEVYLKSINK